MSKFSHPQLRRLATRMVQCWIPLWLAAGTAAHGAAWSEPDLVVFGKVLNSYGGSVHQLFHGVLHVQIISPGQVLELTTDLHSVGFGSEFSYRLRIPQYFQPSDSELNKGIQTGTSGMRFAIAYMESEDSQEVIPVRFVDRTQLESIETHQNKRGSEYRVDLALSFAEDDHDADGLPDWWEQLHGLNAFSNLDASLDPDEDGLTNLQEFQEGTDPNEPNFTPILMDDRLYVPAGGRAGVAFQILDQDSLPNQILLSCRTSLAGLTWYRLDRSIPQGVEFSLQEVMDGDVAIEATTEFHSGSIQLHIRDLKGNGSPDGDFHLAIHAFSPTKGIIEKPVIWLDAGELDTNTTSLSEWVDLSSSARDAYQPAPATQPLMHNGQVRFDGGRFFYLDDRGLRTPRFTAFMAFNANPGGVNRQTLFRSADLHLELLRNGGNLFLQARESGRSTIASLPELGAADLYTLTAGDSRSQLESPDRGVFLSTENEETLPFAYASLGAYYPLSSQSPSNMFQGDLREMVIYGSALAVEARSLVQDYQLSRWEGFLVWRYRHALHPLKLVGVDEVRNSMSGGSGDDTLTGGSQGDFLYGGPGRNALTGGPGPDRFVFGQNVSHDTVTDFSVEEGDVLDLTDVMIAPYSTTTPKVAFHPMVTRGTNDLPRVDLLIEIAHGGEGTKVDQTIVLQNLADLPPSALRTPLPGSLSEPPRFVTVESAGSAVAGANWLTPVPNLVDGTRALDSQDNPVLVFQTPTPGTLVGPGTNIIMLTARDGAWNTVTTTSMFVVTAQGSSHAMSWNQNDRGNLRIAVPAGTVLEWAQDPTGPWTPLPASERTETSPEFSGKARFFRLRNR